MPPKAKPPMVTVKSPAPRISATPTVNRLRGSEKSTRLSTQMRAMALAIRPNTDTASPASTGAGMVCRIAPNLGDRPRMIAATAAISVLLACLPIAGAIMLIAIQSNCGAVKLGIPNQGACPTRAKSMPGTMPAPLPKTSTSPYPKARAISTAIRRVVRVP